MEINNATGVYFSPTKSTKKITLQVLNGLEMPKKEVDLTNHDNFLEKNMYTYDEMVVFGTPTFGGRVPVPFLEKLEKIQGRNTPAVLVVTYGNRAYDDILLELKDFVEKRGFIVIAVAAIIAEHNIMRIVATNRPDKDDISKIDEFIEQVKFKIEHGEDIVEMDVEVPGRFPYREFSGIPFKPKTLKTCDKCGKCIEMCPVGAINVKKPTKINKKVCISCMRCIRLCPNSARKLSGVVLGTFEKNFAVKYSTPKTPEFFI